MAIHRLKSLWGEDTDEFKLVGPGWSDSCACGLLHCKLRLLQTRTLGSCSRDRQSRFERRYKL